MAIYACVRVDDQRVLIERWPTPPNQQQSQRTLMAHGVEVSLLCLNILYFFPHRVACAPCTSVCVCKLPVDNINDSQFEFLLGNKHTHTCGAVHQATADVQQL